MNTVQSTVGRGIYANSSPQTAPNAAQTSPTLDNRQHTHPLPQHDGPNQKIELTVRAGDQFHQLYFALRLQMESQVEDMVATFDPNDLDEHLQRWDEFTALLDLFDQLIPRLNFYANALEQFPFSGNTIARSSDLRQERVERFFEQWEEKVKFHPGLKRE